MLEGAPGVFVNEAVGECKLVIGLSTSSQAGRKVCVRGSSNVTRPGVEDVCFSVGTCERNEIIIGSGVG
jgi:hypothetical protein